jgi:hypothetical protein
VRQRRRERVRHSGGNGMSKLVSGYGEDWEGLNGLGAFEAFFQMWRERE